MTSINWSVQMFILISCYHVWRKSRSLTVYNIERFKHWRHLFDFYSFLITQNLTFYCQYIEQISSWFFMGDTTRSEKYIRSHLLAQFTCINRSKTWPNIKEWWMKSTVGPMTIMWSIKIYIHIAMPAQGNIVHAEVRRAIRFCSNLNDFHKEWCHISISLLLNDYQSTWHEQTFKKTDAKSNWNIICPTTSDTEQTDHVSTVFICLWAIGYILSSIYAMVERMLCWSRFICISCESWANWWYRENRRDLSYSQETTASYVNQDRIATANDSLGPTYIHQPLCFFLNKIE